MKQNSQPHFSVIIPTYHRNDLLAKCLDCLGPGKQEGMVLVVYDEKVRTESENQVASSNVAFQDFEFPLSAFPTYEVIVADDGRASTAEAMIRERFAWARWVQGPGTGPAGNRNAGATLARGEWLAFTDDDCLPQPGWLNAFAKARSLNPSAQVLEGRTSPDRARKTLAEDAPSNMHGGLLWSCNLALRHSGFVEIGGFDSDYRVCMEDNDFALRTRKANMLHHFVPEALVIHPWRPKSLRFTGWKRLKDECKDIAIFIRKHTCQQNVLTPARFLKTGVRNCLADIRFIVKQGDWAAIPLAFGGLWHAIRLAFYIHRHHSDASARSH